MKHNPGKLYKVEIVDRDPKKKMVKQHYKDFSSNDDIWVDDNTDVCPIVKITKCHVPSDISFRERKFRFYEEFNLKVQKSLYFHRTMDPQCTLLVNGDVDIFQTMLDLCAADGTCKFKLASLNVLDCLLGVRWYVRI